MKKLTSILFPALFFIACDRTHPDVKLLTDVRESITPMTSSPDALPEQATTIAPPGAHDELLITPDAAVLELGDYVEDFLILEALATIEPDQKTARHAFSIPMNSPGARLDALSNLERKASPRTLLITPDARLDVAQLAVMSQAALRSGWQATQLRLSADHVLLITPEPTCPEPEGASENSFAVRGEQLMASADAARMEGGACEAVTLHWMPDGAWMGSLRHARTSGSACQGIPERATPGAYDELDAVACDDASDPAQLLVALATTHNLCDTVTLNPLAGHTAADLPAALEAMMGHRAARRVTITHLPTPARPERCR